MTVVKNVTIRYDPITDKSKNRYVGVSVYRHEQPYLDFLKLLAYMGEKLYFLKIKQVEE